MATEFCILHLYKREKQAQCSSGASVECLVEWFTVHWVDLLHNWLLLKFITEVGFFCLPRTDSNLSVPPTSLRMLLLLFAHCTPAQVQCTASGRIIRWLLVHSHRSVICKGIYVSPERKPLTAFSFWYILISMSSCSRAVFLSSYRESYSSFPPHYNRGASGGLHSEIFTTFILCPEGGFLQLFPLPYF